MANEKKRLNKRIVEGLKPKAKAYDVLDTEAAGLRLRVLPPPSGLKVWYHRGRCHGRDRWVKLGEYHPEVLDVKAARLKSAETRAAFQRGDDPTADDRSEIYTLGDLFEVYLSEERAGDRKASGIAADELNWNTFLKRWEHRPLAEVTTAEVRALLGRIAERKVTRTDPETKRKKTHGGPTAANRVRSLLSSVWNYADAPDHPPNPCTASVKPRTETKRKTYIPADRLPDFLKAVRSVGGDFSDAVLLGLLAGLRRSNLLGLRWEWVGELTDDGNGWSVDPERLDGEHLGIRIPAEHFKGKRVHCVALVPEAAEILKRRRAERPVAEFVFPSDRSETGHLADLRGQWAKLVPYLVARDRNGAEHPCPRPGWHSLRHTLGTALANRGGLELVGGVLGHSAAGLGGISADYDRGNPERYRAELRDVAAVLLSDGGKVVPIGKGRRSAK